MFGGSRTNNEDKTYSLQNLLDRKWITYHLDGNHGGEYPRAEEFVNDGVPYISANCIKDGSVSFANAKFVTQERAQRFRKGIAQNRDVLFAHNATVGPVALLETQEPVVILGTSLTAYRCNESHIIPEYLKAYMGTTSFTQQYESEMQQTTRKQVPITAQRKYKFIIPDIDKQSEFASFIQQLDKSKVTIRKSIEKLELLYKALLQEYFG